MRIFFTALLATSFILSFAQKPQLDSNFIFWSKHRHLKESDFAIKTTNKGSHSFGQYSFDYNIVGAFTFGLPKDYKKKIRNYFIKSASWIDTTSNIALSLNYQQTLFDMSEIYVRRFRKEVYQNRKKINWGKLKLEDISSIVMTDFANRRAVYEMETKSGNIMTKQKNWERIIKRELEELTEFAVD
ncbi:hypothetical protein D3C87_271350 [compost metagenome]